MAKKSKTKATKTNKEMSKIAKTIRARLENRPDDNEERIEAAIEASKKVLPDLDDATREKAVRVTSAFFYKSKKP